MSAVLGQQRCPHCGEKLRALKPPGTLRRDCRCGRRWTITFQPVAEELSRRLGQEAFHLEITPYVDGRKRPAPEAGQRLFEEEATAAGAGGR